MPTDPHHVMPLRTAGNGWPSDGLHVAEGHELPSQSPGEAGQTVVVLDQPRQLPDSSLCVPIQPRGWGASLYGPRVVSPIACSLHLVLRGSAVRMGRCRCSARLSWLVDIRGLKEGGGTTSMA